MSDISFFDIEETLATLLAARSEVQADIDEGGTADHTLSELQGELVEIEKALAEYAKQREPAKVDGIHGYLKWAQITADVAKQEAKACYERARRITANADRLKAFVMDAMVQFGKDRVEGTGGKLIKRQKNGGVAGLVVDGWNADAKEWAVLPTVLPEEFIDVTVRMTFNRYAQLCDEASVEVLGQPVMEPAGGRIREALATDCPKCEGRGNFIFPPKTAGGELVREVCADCDGSGKRKVPGARLAERGEHLRLL